MTVLTILMLLLCVKLGFWQLNKAAIKQALQAQLIMRQDEPAVALPDKIASLEDWRYKRVKFSGQYDTRYQLLLDNQVEDTVAGYHVLTPMQVKGSKLYVLVNRGWIPRANAKVGTAIAVPSVETPSGLQELEGDISLPAAKFFTLEAPAPKDGKRQTVWQHLDITRYAKSVPFAVQPFVVRLYPNSKAGGFVRNWPPPGERVTMHLGYAYQWFGFAVTLFVIFIVLNVKQKNIELKNIELKNKEKVER
jgi:surfeit locus 1 family protein